MKTTTPGIRWATGDGGLPAGLDVASRDVMHEWVRRQQMTHPSRLPALDWVKTAAIHAVVLAHAVPGFFGNLQVLLLTGFPVPAFLFVSGFLSKADSPVGWRQVAERCSRVLPPYLVASAVVWALGLIVIPTPRKLVFTIVTGAALGHYFFVPILVLCFLLLPLLSRLSTSLLMLTAVVLMGFSEALWVKPEWRLSDAFFWQMRDPVLQYHVGHFILGMIAYRHGTRLMRTFERHALAFAVVTGVGILTYGWMAGAHPAIASYPVARTTYTLAIIAFLTASTSQRPVPPVIRFLSDATLTIYLYHWFAYVVVMPWLGPMPLALRLPLLAAVGIAFGSLVAIAGRRLLGARSRLLVGA